MSIEKTFNNFIVLHEKKHMTRDIRALEKNILVTTEKTSSILGDNVESDIQEANDKLKEGMRILKKILIKHKLYEI